MKLPSIVIKLLLLLLLVACQDSSRDPGSNKAPFATPPQDTLSAEQTEKIKRIHSALAEVNQVSLEEFTKDLKTDPNRDTEIESWLRIAGAYEKYISSRPAKPAPEIKKEIFSLILSCSMMPDEEAIRSAQLKLLTKKEIKEIIGYYYAEPNPFDVEKKP